MSFDSDAPRLRELGWDDVHAEDFTAQRSDDSWPGRVSRLDRGGWVTVETAEGSQRARLHARFRRVSDALETPTVGDWMILRHDPGGGPSVAEVVLPRRTLFVRHAGDDHRAQPQPLAANIDAVLIVVSLTVEYNARRVDRLLALAYASGAEPVIVLTKADVTTEPDERLQQVRDHVGQVPVHVVSARTGQGLDGLTSDLVPGHTVVLIGPSGAGKSTLANCLAGAELLARQAVRKDGKGRHTTTHRQLLRLPSGALLIDTPGLRSIGLWEPAEQLTGELFDDIEQLASQCRFSDCAHSAEPGCAVRAALAGGTLDPRRWDSYHTLREEAEQRARSRVVAARAQRGGRRRPP